MPSLGVPILEKAADGLSGLGALPRGLEKLPAEDTKGTKSDSDPYVWVRLSKDYLADYVEREVDRETPARDRILGITFVGTSRTKGETKLVLQSSEDRALGEVVFEGKIQSRTTGHKGPATLYYLSNSTFRARKELVISDSGLRTCLPKRKRRQG